MPGKVVDFLSTFNIRMYLPFFNVKKNDNVLFRCKEGMLNNDSNHLYVMSIYIIHTHTYEFIRIKTALTFSCLINSLLLVHGEVWFLSQSSFSPCGASGNICISVRVYSWRWERLLASRVESKGAAKRPPVHRASAHNQELSHPEGRYAEKA